MAVDTLRANYGTSPILISEPGKPVQMPTFSDRYVIYGTGATDPASTRQEDLPLVNDYQLQVYNHRFAATPTLLQWPIYSGGQEFLARSFLAQLGFKPDTNFYRKGWPLLPVEMSRVADLEAVNSTRNGYVHTNPLLQSHVVPYTYLTFTATSTLTDLAAIGAAGDGLFAPYPYPRVLNAWRVYDVTNNRRHSPNNSIIAGLTRSGPGYVNIRADGTVFITSRSGGNQFRSGGTHGLLVTVPGDTYEIQIGHTEPFPGANSAPNQRWTSAAFGNQDWTTGTPIPP